MSASSVLARRVGGLSLTVTAGTYVRTRAKTEKRLIIILILLLLCVCNIIIIITGDPLGEISAFGPIIFTPKRFASMRCRRRGSQRLGSSKITIIKHNDILFYDIVSVSYDDDTCILYRCILPIYCIIKTAASFLTYSGSQIVDRREWEISGHRKYFHGKNILANV